MKPKVEIHKTKSKPLKVRPRTKGFKEIFKFNLNFKLIAISSGVLILLLTLGIGVYFLMVEYKFDKYKTNNLKHIQQNKLNSVMTNYISQPLVNINTSSIESDILKSSIYVKNVKVSKSLFDGIVIEIVEYEPLLSIKTPEGKMYLITTENIVKEVSDESEVKNLIQINFLSNDINSLNIDNTINKVLKIYNNLSKNMIGVYSFDNFGNLSILQEGDKIIRFDLNERFFTIDEQVSLLQDTLAKNRNFSEIDLRFSYLLIK